MIRSLLRKKLPASRLALTIGVGSTLLALQGAQAQQISDPASSQAPETAPVERVVITGSNIPTSEEVGAAPVDTVDQAIRDRTGQEDVLSVLTSSTPAISSGGGNLGQSNASIASGNTYGGSQVSVHGLPTLVLLNGRRLTDSSAAAAGGLSFTDVNLFPSALVKRIEVLKDGASAIYGTEAIGGVINVILEQEFQGFAISGRYGFTEKSDVHNQRYSAIFGVGDDKTHIVVGAEYSEQDPLFTRQRSDLNSTRVGQGPFATGAGFVTTTVGGVIRARVSPTAASPSIFVLNQALNSPSDVTPPGSVPLPVRGVGGGVSGFPAGTYLANTVAPIPALNQVNLSRFTGITLDQNRTDVIASADRELIEKHVVAFADILYASNYSQSYLAPQPVSNNTGVVIPAGAPYNPFNGTIDGTTASATSVLANNRFLTNPRVFRNDTDFYRIVAGLKGEIVKNVNYEVAFNGSRDELTFKNPNLVIASDVNAAVRGGYDAAGNAVPATFDAAGNVLTPAGNYSIVRGNLQPSLDFFARSNPTAAIQNIFGTNIRYLVTKFDGVDGKITAFPFELPAGPVGFAFGGEWRHEFLKGNDSPEVFVGSVPIGDINVGRDVYAGFAEVQVPLVSPSMKIPGVYRADLDAAGRYEEYQGTGSTWVPKVGFTYQPIKDIALRGSFSKSFIAPTLYQTQGPSSNGFTSSYNIGGGQEQAQSLSGSNPNLASPRADTYTAGIVISPEKVPGLTLNVDFFHVEEDRLIGTIDPVTAINNVNTLGTASIFSPFVHVGSFTGSTNNAAGSLAGNGPSIFVTSTQQNLGRQRIGGLDFGANYTHDFGAFGTAQAGIQGTYYLQYKVETLKGLPSYDIIGVYNGLAGETEQYHLTPTVSYSIYGATVSAIGNYIPSLRDANSIGGIQTYDPSPIIGGYNLDKNHELPKIRDYFTIDLLLSYEFTSKPSEAPVPAPKDGKDRGKNVAYNTGKDVSKSAPTSQEMAKQMNVARYFDGLKLSFGIQNLTNARPPLIVGSPDSTNTDASIYDPYQRQYYFVISKKF